MGQMAPVDRNNRAEQGAPHRTQPVHGAFKPLALPALASAVHMNQRRVARPAAERVVPAILREDAVLG